MGNCETYMDWVSAHLDGALSGEERRELLAHLDVCPDCRAYFQDQTAIREALSQLEIPAPEGFTARVMEQVRSEAAPEKKVVLFPGWRRWAALAACCAVVCLGVWGSGALAPKKADAGIALLQDAPAEALEEERKAEDSPAAAARAAEPAPAAGAPAIQQDSAPVEDAAPDSDLEASQTPAAEKRSGALGGGTLTASGPAARTWVEAELGLPWEPGAAYELTEEQYLDLTALLAEAGETFQESAGAAEGWLLLAGEAE